MVRYRSGIFRHVLKFVLLSAAASAAPPDEARAGGEHELARGPVTRELVVRTAIAKSPALRAASSRKQALLAESRRKADTRIFAARGHEHADLRHPGDQQDDETQRHCPQPGA